MGFSVDTQITSIASPLKSRWKGRALRIFGKRSIPHSDGELSYVYDKTGGYCYHCWARLAWKSYGTAGAPGAWEVGRSNSTSPDGTNGLRSLVPSCTPCARSDEHPGARQFQPFVSHPLQ